MKHRIATGSRRIWPWIRAALVTTAAVPLTWVAYASTASYLRSVDNPELAMRLWPSAIAKASLASQWTGDTKSLVAHAAESRRLALEALRRSPVNPIASRALALTSLAASDVSGARRQFEYGESVSRRDLSTQLWLIEDSVARDDIPSALQHYNRALLTTEAVQATLLPVLASAAEEPAILKQLIAILRNRPQWWPGFVDQLSMQSVTPAPLTETVKALKLDPRSDLDRGRVAAVLTRLVDIDAAPAASTLYAQFIGHKANSVPSNGDFEIPGGFGPFAWRLSDSAEHAAAITPIPGAIGGFALGLNGGQPGEAARQLILLAPGRYRLTATVGNISAQLQTPPFLSLACNKSPTPLASKNFPRGDRQNFALDFTIPDGCVAQWLVIYTAAGTELMTETPWIDSIRIALTGKLPAEAPAPAQ